MQKLLDGVRRFQQEIFPAKHRLFEQLSHGQHPQVLFITCSDSRVVPSLVTGAEPGELFVLRNAGNVVPPYSSAPSAEAATIEYAVAALGVQYIVVCGHSRCGAVQAMLEPEHLEGLPAVRSFLEQTRRTVEVMQTQFAHVTEPSERWRKAVEVNVLVQLEHLRSHPSVAQALEQGRLRLHGWVYEFENGRVWVHDPNQQQFLPVA